MNDENRTVPTDGPHSSKIKLPDTQSETVQRNISSAPTVHTGKGGDDIKLPEAKSDIISDTGAPRFIRTGSTPKIAVHEQKKEETDVEKFTDRLSVRPRQQSRTGYTGKINTYAEARSVSETGSGRMITGEATDGTKSFVRNDFSESEGFVFELVDEEETASVGEAEQKKSTDEGEHVTDTSADTSDGVEQGTDGDISETGDNPKKESATKKMPEKGGLLRKIAGSVTDDVPHDPDQLMMDGYSDNDEDVREEALRETREKKISSFHFWNKAHVTADENTDEKFSSGETKRLPSFLQSMSERFSGLNSSFTPVKGEEYTEAENRKAVFARLISTRNGCMMRTVAVGLLGLILLIIDIVVSASASSSGGFFTVLGGNPLVYNIINSVFLVTAAAIMFPDLLSGVCSLLKVHPKTDTSLLIVYILAIIQNAAMYSSSVKAEFDMHLLTPAAILLSAPLLVAKLFFYDSTRQCFKAVSSKSDKSYLRRVSDIGLVRELLRDSEADGDINVVYAGKTKFIRTFLERSAKCAEAAMPSSRLVLIGGAVSVLIGVLAGITGKSFAAAATGAALASLCSFPVSGLLFLAKALADENKGLSLKSSFIQSYADVRDFSCVDDLVIDAGEVISAEVTKCISAKDVKEKQAMFVAGALTSVSGGVLKKAFAGAVAGFEERMPPVDGLVYEDKLGVSAWVSGCKILLGTHALLVNHNVGVPDEGIVQTLIEEGCLPVYLAIEGRFAALYSVKYTPVSYVADNLAELAKSGSNILISNVDPNLTDSYTEKLLHLPEDSVRMLSKKVSDKMETARTAVTDSEEAGIVFGDSVDSLCRCAVAALRLDAYKRMSKLLAAGASAFGLLITVLLVLTGAYVKCSAVVPLAFQIISGVFCFIFPCTLAKSVKPRRRKKLKNDYTENVEHDATDEKTESADTPDRDEKDATADGECSTDESVEDEKSDEHDTADTGKKAENETAERDGDTISEATISALDSFAEDEEKAKGTWHRADGAVADGDDVEIDTQDDDTDSVGGFGAISFKLKDVLKNLTSRFKNASDESGEDEKAEQNDSGEEEPPVFERVEDAPRRRRETAQPDTKAEASTEADTEELSIFRKLASRKKDTYDTAYEIEEDYRRKKAEDERVRSIFTAPKMPEKPHRFGAEPEKKEPDRGFTPPESVSGLNFFDDSVFSPFEDDKIFAGLRDESQNKYDF